MSLKNPVKYPVKFYTWQDANAPQLSDADGVIKTILKACLVTGYGDKQGAGWTSLFEDAYRMVLRRPLRLNNPPDVKIENGTFAVNGTNTTRHRIVAHDNATGLDDTNELSAVNLYCRNPECGKGWYCIVTDFAFLLIYQIGEYNNNQPYQALYVGETPSLYATDTTNFLFNYPSGAKTTGDGISYLRSIMSTYVGGSDDQVFKNMKNAQTYVSSKQYLQLGSAIAEIVDDQYMAQRLMIGARYVLPFFAALRSYSASDGGVTNITFDNRPAVRFVQSTTYNNNSQGVNIFYIPIDYWEL